MESLSGYTVCPVGELSPVDNGAKDGYRYVFFNGASVGGLLTNFLAAIKDGSRGNEDTKDSYCRPLIFFRLFRRVLDNCFTVVFRDFTGLKFSNFCVRQDAPVMDLFIRFYTFVPFTFRNVGVCCCQVLGVFRFERDLGRYFRVVTIIRMRVVRSRDLRRVAFTLAITIARVFRILMGAAIVLNGERLVIISGGGRIYAGLHRVIRSFRYFATAWESITCRNCSVLVATNRITSFHRSTDRASKDKDIASGGGVVLAFI